MTKRAFLVVVPALLAITFAIPQSVQAHVIFCDDFESYALNTYPAPPWTNMFSGFSGYVTDEQANTPTQSYRSESRPNWARWDYVTLAIPDHVIYEAAVYLTAEGRGGAVGFGFMQPGTTNTGRWANAVYFGNDGNIYFSTQTAGSTLLGSWTPGMWYKVGVKIDYENLLANVYINYALVGENVPADPKVLPASVWGVEIPLDQFGMFGQNFSGAGTSVIYYDDMCVRPYVPVPVEESSWGRIKAMFND
jgi:hypothetical protein